MKKAKEAKAIKVKMTSRIGLRVAPETLERIGVIAGIRGQVESEAIRDIITLGLESMERIHEVNRRLAA